MKLVGISALALFCLLVAGVTCNYYGGGGGYVPYYPQQTNNNSWWGSMSYCLLNILPIFYLTLLLVY
jgi:hypothetical protein